MRLIAAGPTYSEKIIRQGQDADISWLFNMNQWPNYMAGLPGTFANTTRKNSIDGEDLVIENRDD